MKVIGIASQKGGAGKSTISAHLAIHADRDQSPALLVDLDPQGSISLWHQLRKNETPLLVKADIRTLPDVLEAGREHGVRWCIIDSAPHAESSIAAVMRFADLVIIPTRAAVFDLGAIRSTLEQAVATKANSMVVLNAVPPRRGFGMTTLETEARAVLASYGAKVWEKAITQRAAYSSAIAGGLAVDELEPGGAAASEITALWAAIQLELNA